MRSLATARCVTNPEKGWCTICTAIAQPAGTETLTIETLEIGWKANPDGGGYAYINFDGEMVTVHSMDRDSFILQYIEDHGTYGDTSPFLIHVRYATHGSVTLENCHPFPVPLQGGSEMVLIHNGIIDRVSDAIKDTDLTDTEGLVKYVLADMGDEWLDNAYLVDYIEDFIDWSKIVFLTTNPELSKEMYILNESSGVWRDKVWYSNWSCFKSIGVKVWHGVRNCGSVSDWYRENNSERYASYNDQGDYIEGTVVAKGTVVARGTTDDFEDWLVDPSERRVQAEDLADADYDEHIEMMNASLHAGDACAICTGITTCLCNELCYLCYEALSLCDCDGPFVSLTQSFGMTWGDRTKAIASASSADEPELKDCCDDNNCTIAHDGQDLPF